MKCKTTYCKREATEGEYCLRCDDLMQEALNDLREEDRELREARE